MRWVIGDVHGMSGPLRTLVDLIRRRDPDATFYFTGDFCDRGPDTRGVVEAVLALSRQGVAHAVRGNHDEVVDLILNGESYASGPRGGGSADDELIGEAAGIFWNEGLPATLDSYGVTFPAEVEDVTQWLRQVRSAVPDDHRRFFRELPGFIDAGDFFVTHASWPPDYPDDPVQLDRDPHLRHEALWGRYTARQILTPKAWRRLGYCGHTPTDSYLGHPELLGKLGDVVFGNGVVLVDTGAFTVSGRLSAVCHDTHEVLQVHHSGEPLG